MQSGRRRAAAGSGHAWRPAAAPRLRGRASNCRSHRWARLRCRSTAALRSSARARSIRRAWRSGRLRRDRWCSRSSSGPPCWRGSSCTGWCLRHGPPARPSHGPGPAQWETSGCDRPSPFRFRRDGSRSRTGCRRRSRRRSSGRGSGWSASACGRSGNRSPGNCRTRRGRSCNRCCPPRGRLESPSRGCCPSRWGRRATCAVRWSVASASAPHRSPTASSRRAPRFRAGLGRAGAFSLDLAFSLERSTVKGADGKSSVAVDGQVPPNLRLPRTPVADVRQMGAGAVPGGSSARP